MTNFNSENLPKGRRCNIKLTLNSLTLILATIFLYFYKIDIGFNYYIINTNQFWRVLVSLLYSKNQYFLIINVTGFLFLSLLREIKKGSFAYLIDIILKHTLIFTFSTFFYLVLFWSAKVHGNVFENLINSQKDIINGGVIYLLVSELLVTLHFLKNNQNIDQEKFFFKNSFLLCLISVVLFYFNYQYISYWAAIFVGFLEINKICKIDECIQKSNFNYFIENQIMVCSSFFYYHHTIIGNSFFESQENKLMKTESTMSERNYSSINSDINKLNFEDGRYDKVNVNDYVLKKNQAKMNKIDQNESFEI